MFKFFKKRAKKDVLYRKYEQLSTEAYELSRYDRKQADLKIEEAERILLQIKQIEKEENS